VIRALVLDYGGVLSTDQGEREQSELCSMLGVEPAGFHAAYWKHRDDYDRGAATAAAYWSAVCVSLDAPFPEHRLDDLIRIDAGSWSHLNQPVVDWTRRMAGRVPLALVSNMPHEVKDALLPTIRGIVPWTATVFSCEVGVMKPGAEIYAACVAKLGVAPRESVMVDDRPENVDGARRVGMAGVHFTQVESLRDEIELLIPPRS
jgi:putative hydrolase of the HAD superfamily